MLETMTRQKPQKTSFGEHVSKYIKNKLFVSPIDITHTHHVILAINQPECHEISTKISSVTIFSAHRVIVMGTFSILFLQSFFIFNKKKRTEKPEMIDFLKEN